MPGQIQHEHATRLHDAKREASSCFDHRQMMPRRRTHREHADKWLDEPLACQLTPHRLCDVRQARHDCVPHAPRVVAHHCFVARVEHFEGPGAAFVECGR